MEKPNILLGVRIRLLRKQGGLTISQLAEMAEMDSGFLNYIEHGKKSPSLNTLARIANALNVSLADLFEKRAVKAEDTFDYQVSNQIRAILTGKTPEEKDKFLAVLKSLKDKKLLSAIFRILLTANHTRRLIQLK
jgi:transcriptional regulator with XRE-family HTH domain